MTHLRDQDLAVVRAVIEAKPQAWDRLIGRVADTVWTACRLLTGDEVQARAAFAEVMEALRADGFRRLRPYDGSSRIETFVALLTRDVLAERLMRLFQPGNGDRGWAAFERFFSSDIDRVIARRLSGADREEARRDARQEICLALIADDYRRLRAYRGVGSFTGFVLHTIDRLLIDIIRRTVPRRRGAETTCRPIMVALAEHEDIATELPNPEQSLLADEGERALTAATEVLRQAAETLSEAEQLYLRVALGGGEAIPAREVARLMQRPVEDVYKLKQRVTARLREMLEHHPAVKLWRASV